jgi:hypothetical protein
MKDFNDFLTGEGWEEDLATGLFLPPGTHDDDLYEIQGGPQHTANPNPFCFVTRKPGNTSVTFGPSVGVAIGQDGKVYRFEDGERSEVTDWREAAAIRQQFIGAFGPAITQAAGIEPE